MTRLEAAEMRFLRSVKGYTRLDRIRSEVIRKELEISGIQDVKLKYNKTGSTSWKNGQHQTPETRPQLRTSRKKTAWTSQETLATRRCRNRSNDLIHGERWWWLINVASTEIPRTRLHPDLSSYEYVWMNANHILYRLVFRVLGEYAKLK